MERCATLAGLLRLLGFLLLGLVVGGCERSSPPGQMEGGAALLAGLPSSPPVLVLQAPAEASVTSVAVSPDGSLVATDSFDGRVRLHDARTGAMLRAIDTGGGRGVAFAPDGRSLACAGYHMDKLVGVYDVITGKLLRKLAGHAELETYAVAFSPDGKLLASAGTDKQILVWELRTGALRHRFANQAFPVTALAFSPDSTTLAGGGGDKVVRLWDTASGQLRRSLTGHGDWVSTVAFSPDGRTIASGSCDWAFHRGRDRSRFQWPDPGCVSEIRLWDAATGDLKRTVAEPGRLLSLAIAPDGNSLVGGIGKDVRLYDLRGEAPGRTLTGHDFDVTGVVFADGGASVVSGSHDQTVKCTSVATGQVKWRAPGHFEQVNSLALSPDGSVLVTGSSDQRFAVRVLKAGDKAIGPGAVRVWDARTGRLLRRLGDSAEQIMAVALSPDVRRIASGGASSDGKGVVRVWDAATGAAVWSQGDHAVEVLAVAFAADGSSFASAGADGVVRLRDPATGAVTRTLEGHDGGATALAFSADGSTLLCGEGRGGTRVWDARTGRLLRTCKDAASQAGSVTTDRMITSVALSPGGETFLACAASVGNTYGESVRLWDTHSGELKREFTNPGIGGRPVVLSPDGNIVAAGGKGIQLSDARTGQPLRRLSGHLKKIQAIAFSSDGRLVFGGGSYGTTNVWEVATGRRLIALFAFSQNRAGKVSDDSLAYHPDGHYDGSSGVEKYLAWRIGDELYTTDTPGAPARRPDRLESALKLGAPTAVAR
jgi:WD40 repeat protein